MNKNTLVFVYELCLPYHRAVTENENSKIFMDDFKNYSYTHRFFEVVAL